MSIRAVVTHMILNFETSFAPTEDGYALLNETKDTVTMSMADLNLVFEKVAA